MESADERQQEEITVLKSIYGSDFHESPPPKAWKGAVRLPEFIIKVTHPDLNATTRVSFDLNVKFPKMYPSKTAPIFTVQQPVGITPEHVTHLSSAIRTESQHLQGSEMVFAIVGFCTDWLSNNVSVPKETPGSSLATEMKKRFQEEEKKKNEIAEAQAALQREQAARLAAKWDEEMQQVAHQKEEAQRREKERTRARKRAMSDATEKPLSDTTVEVFDEEVVANGMRFQSVKLFLPRQEWLGTTWSAEPICDNEECDLQLDLHVVVFESHYYTTNPGRKKLRQIESEVSRLAKIQQRNIQRVYAVKLTIPTSTTPSKLFILMEPCPPLSLQQVLENCDSLREERASDYLGQILSALHAIHVADLVHRGLAPSCIGLVKRGTEQQASQVKIGNTAFYTKLYDMHKSDPFGPNNSTEGSSNTLPDSWLPAEAVDSPLVYTRSRDIHAAGVVLLQMLMGLDVVKVYQDPKAALRAATFSPTMHRIAVDIFTNNKKTSVSCLSLLGKLAATAFHPVGRSRAISIDDPKTPMPRNEASSPQFDLAPLKEKSRQASRWKEDWEELELLGRGGFGSVVKARNKLDHRIYAVKKIKLRASQSDSKIFREVNALSRLSHRFIVRYYTTWLETMEPSSSNASDSEDNSTDDGSSTSVGTNGDEDLDAWKFSDEGRQPQTANSSDDESNQLSYDIADYTMSEEKRGFPRLIPVADIGADSTSDEDSDGVIVTFADSNDGPQLDIVPHSPHPKRKVLSAPRTPLPNTLRTLYIQMEFVERQTLMERIAEGLSEEDSWRLFQQIVDALVHMSSLGILHRDIKLTNIFIDSNGDCKVGDFGLAVSSLAAVDPSDVSPQTIITESDMTLEVGTKLYIAPEVLTRTGARAHTKADIYSLGIVFFEMNYSFSTGSERIAVLEALRRPDIAFPSSWDPKRIQQKKIITWLLQHDPADRPTAIELSQSSLLPSRVEDEYFKGALGMMAKPDSPYYQSVLKALFDQSPALVRGFLYESDAPEHAHMNRIVVDKVAELFRLHGAINVEPPLLLPHMRLPVEDPGQTFFMDRHGDIVMLPAHGLIPFARLAARTGVSRIKRYNIGNIYRHSVTPGHPKILKAAVLDVVTPDLVHGPEASTAEMLGVIDRCMNAFPGLDKYYQIHISHSRFYDMVLERIPTHIRSAVLEVLTQVRSATSFAAQKPSLANKGVPKHTLDEIELFVETYEDVEILALRVKKISVQLGEKIKPLLADIRKTLEVARATGVARAVMFRPLMVEKRQRYFKNGICFEVVRTNKRADCLAAGGRYDHLIREWAPPGTKAETICAVGMQISLDKITTTLALFQRESVSSLLKEQRSFGYWSVRRCDVYVASFQTGQLTERLEIANMLWEHGISADVMYEAAVGTNDLESIVEQCSSEGILYVVLPRAKTPHRELTIFKVKSVLRGTEHEVPRPEIIGWLNQQIAEQRKFDSTTSGVMPVQDASASLGLTGVTKDAAHPLNLQLLMPGDAKKQLKRTKQLFYERAYAAGLRVKQTLQSGNAPMIAVDVPSSVFDALVRNDDWVTDDEAWRAISSGIPTSHVGYANQVREAVEKRKEEFVSGGGCEFVLMFSVKEERVALLTFTT